MLEKFSYEVRHRVASSNMFTLLARKQYHTQQTSMPVFTGAILQVTFLHVFQSYPGRYMFSLVTWCTCI